MKTFLSSTYQDLVAHRKAAAKALERLGLEQAPRKPRKPLAKT